MADFGSKMGPRWAQDGPKMAPRGHLGAVLEPSSALFKPLGAKMLTKTIKLAPRRGETLVFDGLRWPEMGPKWPQDGPEMAPKWPQDGSKMAPRWSQDGSKKLQNASKGQDGSNIEN